MTTYLLSKKISLESIYTTSDRIKSFFISLDREAETPDQMKEKVKKSFASFTELEQSNDTENNISDYKEGSKCYTKFVYEYDAEGKKTAEIGIADLHKSIPLRFHLLKRSIVLK
ncbi:hypothetical protein H9W95_18325 [Flavobacterium lindanitolerans]|nr:hypothetical protein [Flavobacterium lindanitolerans]